MPYIFILPLILLSFAAVASQEEALSCAQDARVVDVCYSVHGRLAVYANLRPRLQPDDKGPLLAIVPRSGLETGEMDYYWPKNVGQTLSPDVDVIADFRVCPFTLPEAGEMQHVCIAFVENMRAEKKGR